MKKLLCICLLVLFTIISLNGYAADNIEWDASAVTVNRKEYSLDKIKTVNMLGTSDEYFLNFRPYYTVEGRDIYYIDNNSILKKINIDTKSEEVIRDITKWMTSMSDLIEKEDPYGLSDNIFLDGGEVRQLFNDTYRNRLILSIYLNQPNKQFYYAIDLETLDMYNVNIESSSTNESLIISAPECIYGKSNIYDEYGMKIASNSSNSGYGYGYGTYRENNRYCVATYGWTSTTQYVNVIDSSGAEKILINNSYGTAFYQNFIYSLQYDGNIKKYNLTGAEREGIKLDNVAICDGLGAIKGQPLFTEDGDMVLFTGTTFRLLSKSSSINISVKNNTSSTVSADLYIVVYNENKTVSKIFSATEDIGADGEWSSSIDYKIADNESVGAFCWKQGTVIPLAIAYKSDM